MNRFAWEPSVYPRLTARAQQLASLVMRRPPRAAIRALFAPSALAKVGPKEMAAKLRELYQDYGPVVSIEPLRVTAENMGMVSFLTARPARLRCIVSLELEEPARVAEFSSTADPLQPDFPAVLKGLGELPGETGLSLWRLAPDGPRELLSHNAEQPLSIASAFKLYVLGALLESGLPLEETVVLTERTRAFASGFLHQWPEGTPLTLLSVAALMISVSDNTATELLMQRLGRAAVEAMPAKMGHAHPELLQPLPSALDLVRLKGDRTGQRGRLYLGLDARGRRAMLAELADLPRESLGISPYPRHLELGWWASPADLCRAQAWLWARTQPGDRVRQLMSINTGVVTSLPYLGFKGGGDAGVVSASFLIEDHSGATYVLGAAWNNREQAVTEGPFSPCSRACCGACRAGNCGLGSGLWKCPRRRVAQAFGSACSIKAQKDSVPES